MIAAASSTESTRCTWSSIGRPLAIAWRSGQAGTASFGVGGQIPISNNTAGGAYVGSFTTTVAYN